MTDAGCPEVRLYLCSDPLVPHVPDSAFEAENEAVNEIGWLFDLLDIEPLLAGDAQRATRQPGYSRASLRASALRSPSPR